MANRKNKRRFYPEFYTDEELERDEHDDQDQIEENAQTEQIEQIDETEETEQTEPLEYDEPEENTPEELELHIDNENIENIESMIEEPQETTKEDAKNDFTENIFDRTKNPEIPKTSIIRENSENSDRDETKNYNMLVYPKRADAAAVSKQIDHMEKDCIQKKINILKPVQKTKDISDINPDENEISIEIPKDMYIRDMPVGQYMGFGENNERSEEERNGNIDEVFADNLSVGESEKIEETNEPEESEEEFILSIPTFEEDSTLDLNMSQMENETELNPEPEMMSNSNIIPFDRKSAIEYAHRWALDRNPNFYNFEDIGGDCTNYISQILHAGGCRMDRSSVIYGWYYNNANDKSPSWTGVEQLYDYLIREKDYGVIAEEIDLSAIEAGDIAQISFNGKSFQHTPFIVSVKRSPDGEVFFDQIKICAHSFDSENRPLDTYQWKKIRFIRILGFKQN